MCEGRVAVQQHLISGVLFMLTKDNVTIGIEWRIGPDRFSGSLIL